MHEKQHSTCQSPLNYILAVITPTWSPKPCTSTPYILSSAVILFLLVLAGPSVQREHPPNLVSPLHLRKFPPPSKEHFMRQLCHETLAEGAPPPVLFPLCSPASVSCSLQGRRKFPAFSLTLPTGCFRVYISLRGCILLISTLWESDLQSLVAIIVEPDWISFINLS